MWAQIIASILGEMERSKGDASKMQLLQEQLKRVRDMALPQLEKLKAEQLGRAEASQVNPELQAAQMEALGRMRQWGTGQLTSEDRAQMELGQEEAARRGQIQQQAIVNRAQQIGQLGGGAQLAMQQQAAQNQGQGAYASALQNMLSMRNRAMQATSQTGQLAGQMSDADMRRKAAQDAVARYNAGARTGVNQYNAQLAQQNFNNAINKENMLNGRAGAVGNQYAANGQSQANMFGNAGAAISQMGSGDKNNQPSTYDEYKASGWTDAGAGDLKDSPYDDEEQQ